MNVMLVTASVLLVAMVTPTAASVIYADEAEFDGIYWGKWINSDNPHGGENNGENETIAHIRKAFGHSCKKSVECDNPDAMEVDFSYDHMLRHEEANFDEAMQCLKLDEDAKDPDIGFYCNNADQVGHSQECLDMCEKNGLQDPYADVKPNCGRCPNVKIRYHCPANVPKTCRSTKSLLKKLLKVLEENDINE